MPTFYNKKNNAKSTLEVADINDLQVTLEVTDATKFPTSGDFIITIWNNVTYPDPGDDSGMEILKVTGVSGTTFTVERGVEDTVGVSHQCGDKLAMLFTVGQLEQIQNEFDNYLALDNIDVYTPTLNYHPTTKLYVDSQIQGENHWDIESGDTLVPYVDNADVNIGSGDFFGNSLTANYTQFNTSYTPPSEPEGLVWWNVDDHTLNLSTGLGPVQQIGQEMHKIVQNDSGSPILDGEVVFISGTLEGLCTIELAKADKPTTVMRVLGVATMDIPDGTHGIVTTFGTVRGIDTSSFDAGDNLYVSADNAGELVNVQPVYPNYIMTIGKALIINETTGSIDVHVIGRIEDILENAWNGGFLESINFTIVSNGTTITGTLENDNNSKDLTMNFSTGFEILDTTTSPYTITLPEGADDNPQTLYVYIPISTKILTQSTSDFPNEEHIKVALCSVRTALTTQSDSALRNQNWNDHVAGDQSGRGHIQHISERIRQADAKWNTGIQGSLSIVTNGGVPDNLFIAVTEGKVYQLHKQAFPALDTAVSDDIHVVNRFTSSEAYTTIDDLNSELEDASGGSLDNRHWSFVVWGIANRTGETSHIMLNLPSGSYNTTSLAQSDPSNYSVYDIPAQFKGVAFLIARFTVAHSPSSGGTWTLNATQDLRGFTPNTTAGGGAGGGGVSTWTGLTDTPSTFVVNNIPRVNDGGTALDFTSDIDIDSANFTTTGLINGGTLSGNNSGDQDLGGYLLNTTDTFTGTLSVDGIVDVGEGISRRFCMGTSGYLYAATGQVNIGGEFEGSDVDVMSFDVGGGTPNISFWGGLTMQGAGALGNIIGVQYFGVETITATGLVIGNQFRVGSGTKDDPGFAFVDGGDNDTGMFLSTQDVLNFAVGGIELLELDLTEMTIVPNVAIPASGATFKVGANGAYSDDRGVGTHGTDPGTNGYTSLGDITCGQRMQWGGYDGTIWASIFYISDSGYIGASGGAVHLYGGDVNVMSFDYGGGSGNIDFWAALNMNSENITNVDAIDCIGVSASSVLKVPIGTASSGTGTAWGSLYLDYDAGANGTLKCYSNGAWQTVAVL